MNNRCMFVWTDCIDFWIVNVYDSIFHFNSLLARDKKIQLFFYDGAFSIDKITTPIFIFLFTTGSRTILLRGKKRIFAFVVVLCFRYSWIIRVYYKTEQVTIVHFHRYRFGGCAIIVFLFLLLLHLLILFISPVTASRKGTNKPYHGTIFSLTIFNKNNMNNNKKRTKIKYVLQFDISVFHHLLFNFALSFGLCYENRKQIQMLGTVLLKKWVKCWRFC